jgi:hypothetical protein
VPPLSVVELDAEKARLVINQAPPFLLMWGD